MKNLSKNLIVTIAMVAIALVFMIKGVSALSLTPGNGNQNTTANTTTNQAAGGLQIGNSTQNSTRNVIKTNNINTGNKDLPQTGENDIYIITGIGILAIAIGGFAYIKSKRFE